MGRGVGQHLDEADDPGTAVGRLPAAGQLAAEFCHKLLRGHKVHASTGDVVLGELPELLRRDEACVRVRRPTAQEVLQLPGTG